MTIIKDTSTLTCPYCNSQELVTMPTEACQFFRECKKCKKVYRAKSWDCCVFCSYGDVACPSIQKQGDCCM